MYTSSTYISELPVTYRAQLARKVLRHARREGLPIGDAVAPLMFSRISSLDNILAPRLITRLLDLINQ